MKKESNMTTNILVTIITIIFLYAASSCSPKYGCGATKNMSGYGNRR